MTVPLRVLILEDCEADAELVLFELRQAGYDPEWSRVDNREDYLDRLSLSPSSPWTRSMRIFHCRNLTRYKPYGF